MSDRYCDSEAYLYWFDKLNENEKKEEMERERRDGERKQRESDSASILSSQLFVSSAPKSLASEQLNAVAPASTPTSTSTPDYSKSFLFQFFDSTTVPQTDFVKRNFLEGANPKNNKDWFNYIIAAIVRLIPNADDEKLNKKRNYDELKYELDLHPSLQKITDLKLLLGLLGYGFFKVSRGGNMEVSQMWHQLNLTSETCKDKSDLDMVQTFLGSINTIVPQENKDSFLGSINTIVPQENKDSKPDPVYTAIKEAYKKCEQQQQQKTEQTQALEQRSSIEQRCSVALR